MEALHRMQKPSVGALGAGAGGVLWPVGLTGLAGWVLAAGALAAGGFGAGFCGPAPAVVAREVAVRTSLLALSIRLASSWISS